MAVNMLFASRDEMYSERFFYFGLSWGQFLVSESQTEIVDSK